MKIIYVIILFIGFIGSAESYKVLVFNPAYGASHSNFLGKLSDILIDGGHEVVSNLFQRTSFQERFQISDNVDSRVFGKQKKSNWI